MSTLCETVTHPIIVDHDLNKLEYALPRDASTQVSDFLAPVFEKMKINYQ